MFYLLMGLVLLGVFALTAGYVRNRKLKKQVERGEISELPSVVDVQNMECCGQHEVCEKDSLLAAISKDIEYYEDEELDRFRGKPSDAYAETEAEEFREVFYSMKEEEVAGWVRSLQLRGIELPDTVKDEVFFVLGERRI